MTLGILHVTTFLQGGAGRVLCDLALYQRRQGHRVVVVTDDSPVPGYESYPEYLARLREGGVRVLPVHATFRRDTAANLRAASTARRWLTDESIDVVHAHAAVPALIGVVARSGLPRRIPVVMSMQGWGNNKTPEQEAADVATMNLLDRVLPVSQAAARLLIGKGVVPGLLTVIPNAVDERHAEAPKDAYASVLSTWRDAGQRLIGCIGSLCERKDQATLIRAFGLLGRGDARLVLIGEGDDKALRDLAGDLGVAERVVFAGYQEDAAACLRHLDVVVLPSRSEGLPLTVLEAFRERVPVIVSDIPENVELVRDGVNGHVFPVGDAAGLADVLREVLDETAPQREARLQAAHASFWQDYRTDVMCERYMDVYRAALFAGG